MHMLQWDVSVSLALTSFIKVTGQIPLDWKSFNIQYKSLSAVYFIRMRYKIFII